MTLKEALNITLSGYGPCSHYTLAEWLEARDLYRSNQSAALKVIGHKAEQPEAQFNL